MGGFASSALLNPDCLIDSSSSRERDNARTTAADCRGWDFFYRGRSSWDENFATSTSRRDADWSVIIVSLGRRDDR